jgi:pimeloyl-ACP methyl ester carboxylesterase
MIKKMFAPQEVTDRFNREFPVGLTLRPSQIHTFSQDAAQMAPSAKALSARYGELSCPIGILAGDADAIVDFESQALRLHKELAASTLDVFKGTGHMLHHYDPARVVQAVLAIEARALPLEGVEAHSLHQERSPPSALPA